ncbi:hypothetical protein ACH4VR_29580 [Streptomyces sp. NPDC020883]|uniref:hypothetical protein n=1 Tax=Streptomyces sp. NPDC020883 TaxID=3365099 RepID=UPI0037AB623A
MTRSPLPRIRHSLTKPRLAAEDYTGALLLQALAHEGVTVQIDQPWPSLPCEFIVCERKGHARVWVHCVNEGNTRMNYDIPCDELWSVMATVTDERNTRLVYCGLDQEGATPRAQAVACAEAVAVQLRLRPFCTSCEDTGHVTIYHHSTGGVTGSRPCQWAPCVKRREEQAAENQRKRAAEEAKAAAHVCTNSRCCPPF